MVWFGNRDAGISSENYLYIGFDGNHIDLSAHSPTIGTGNAFLAWIRPHKIGDASNINHPGIAAASTDAFDGWYSFRDESGTGPHLSGTHDASMAIDTDGGTEDTSPTFSLELESWHLVGFSVDTSDVVTWFFDGSAIGTTDFGTFDGITYSFVGHGYGGHDENGTSSKDIDEIMKFDRGVTESEVGDFWNGEAFPSPVAHHYRFEDPDSGDTAVDSEGGEDGTIVDGSVGPASYQSPGAF